MSVEQYQDIIMSDKIDSVVESAIKRGKKTILLKKVTTALASFAILVALTVAISYASPTVASGLSNLPVIGQMFKHFTDGGLRTASEKGLTDFPGIHVTKGDASVSLKEIYYDSSWISLGLEMKGITPLRFKSIEIYYGKQVISNGFSGGIIKEAEDHYYFCITTDIPENLPDKMELTVLLKEYEPLEREFEFHATVDRTLSKKNTIDIKVMKSIKCANGTFTIKKVQLTPGSVTVDFESDVLFAEETSISITDNNGNKPMMNHCTGTSEVVDGKETFTYKASFNPLDPVPEWITIDFSNAQEEGIRIEVVGRK